MLFNSLEKLNQEKLKTNIPITQKSTELEKLRKENLDIKKILKTQEYKTCSTNVNEDQIELEKLRIENLDNKNRLKNIEIEIEKFKKENLNLKSHESKTVANKQIEDNKILYEDDELEKLRKENLDIKNRLKNIEIEIEKLKHENLCLKTKGNKTVSLQPIVNIEDNKILFDDDNKLEKLRNENLDIKNRLENIEIEIEKLKQENKTFSVFQPVTITEVYENEELEKLRKENLDIKNRLKNIEIEKLRDENLNLKKEEDDKTIPVNQKTIPVNQKTINVIEDPHKILYGKIIVDICDKIYDHLKLSLLDQKLTISNITYIIVDLMKFLEKCQIESLSKKNIIIATIEKYILDEFENIENIDEIKVFMQSVPNLVDIYKSIDNKEIRIKLKKVHCFFPLCN